MSEIENTVFLGQFELNEAKTIQIKLNSMNIETEIRAHDGTCSTRNCKVTVELWSTEEHLPVLREFFRNDFFKNIGTDKVNFEALNAVYDSSAEQVTCQACGFKFSPTNKECPDCGLCY